MPNLRVVLQMYVKTAEGWRRYPAAYAKNGRVRPNHVLVDGVAVHFPEGHYEIKYYEGRKTVQRNVGTDAQAAQQERDREANLLEVRHTAGAIGVKLLEEPGRLNLSSQAEKFVQAAEDRGSNESAEVYRGTVEEFL